VCSFDIWRIAQTRPGRSLRFKAIGVEEAHLLLAPEEIRWRLADALPPGR
jgi:allophanate hydrolase subunit 2